MVQSCSLGTGMLATGLAMGVEPQIGIGASTSPTPVRLTEFSITEEAFDPALNPIRAKVNLGMRVLTVDDLPFAHKGSSLFMNYLQAKEQMAARSVGVLNTLGIGAIP